MRQLDRVSRELLARPGTPGQAPGTRLDDRHRTVCETYGLARERAIIVAAGTGDVLMGGQLPAGDGGASCATGALTVRADLCTSLRWMSAFHHHDSTPDCAISSRPYQRRTAGFLTLSTVRPQSRSVFFVEADHRRHAEVENAIRDLKYGLNHLPSGRFAANAAWLAVQVMAHNLARWSIGLPPPRPCAGSLAGRLHRRGREPSK